MTDCTVCMSLQETPPVGIETTYGQLKKTALHGCKLCFVLFEVSKIAHLDKKTVPVNDDVVLFVRPSSEQDTLSLQSWSGSEGSKVLFHLEPVLVQNGLHDDQPSIKDCTRFIKGTIEKCNTHHPQCSVLGHSTNTRSTGYTPTGIFQGFIKSIKDKITTGSGKFIPTRLLYVGNRSQHNGPRLYELPPGTRPIQYVALSHRWGTEQVVQTTEAKRHTFQNEGIPWSHLSKTFQESIAITREIGLDYIWIDSLCIIQDSMEDWAREASQMANIFANAHLTIGASAAEKGCEGLLNRHAIHKLTMGDEGHAYTVCVRRTAKHDLRGYSETRDFPQSTDLTLRTRAWCLQEELLSPRFVHFTSDEMVYVCREGTTCECNSSWLPRFKLPGPVSSEEDFDSSSSASLNMWTEVVEHYSRRHISFHQDRLPAISSLASFYEEAAGRYLAGLWESHLPECLLWWTDRGHRPEPSNSSMSYPPSWSWASTEGAVITRSSGETWLPTASVLDVSVHPSTSDPKGLVSGGYITVQGHLLPLQSSWHRDDLENDYTFRQYNINCHTTWQAGDGLEWTDGHAWHCSLDNIGSLRPLPKAGEFDTPVFLLIIGTSNHGGLHKSYRTFEGLTLKPVENLNELQMKATKRFGSELACVRFGLGMLRLRAHSVDLPKDCTKTVTIF